MDILEAYQRAAAVHEANSQKSILNETVQEYWIQGTDDFWYAKDIANGQNELGVIYTRYSYSQNKQCPLFCHKSLADLIAPRYVEKADPFKLPIEILEVNDQLDSVYFTIEGAVGEFVYYIKQNTVERLRFALHAKDVATSPDKKHTAFIRNHNIFCRDNNSGKEIQLTFDGEQDLDYGLSFQSVSNQLLLEDPPATKPAIVWSPNSKYFITYRTDTRLVGKYHLVQSAPRRDVARPIGVSYPYALPGDEHINEAQVYVGNIEEKKVVKVLLDEKPVVLLLLSMFGMFGPDSEQVKWTEDSRFAYFVRCDRFFKTPQCIVVEAASFAACIIWQETYETFCFIDYFGTASQESYMESSIKYLPDTEELIWHSEIEGWAAFYLYDVETGKLKRKLTTGDWVARRIKYVDEKRRLLYFTGCGLEKGVDPYYQFLYKVNLDTGELVKISEELAEHYIRFAPSARYYIDTYSTVQTAPVTVVRNPQGKQLLHITTADLSRIIDKGYIFAEPFTALARDGETPVYGVIVKPHNFDPSKKYPVVDYIYGGSQRINTPKAFKFGRWLDSPPFGGLQGLAHLGFVGVIVDGLATPLRSKRIHDYVYGKAEECCGIEDHVEAIKQLGQQHAWIDVDRVGIWGASGGGYATARALLAFPEFYKVGVSLCGNHDQAKYYAHWGERWIGEYSEEGYFSQANQNVAAELQGHLLLVHGDMDDNVHPSSTIKLVEALIKANRDFDLLIVPNCAHMVAHVPYVVRRKWDYFVRHLAGLRPPCNFKLGKDKDKENSI